MDDIEKISRRTLRYWYEDGLAEMATGFVFALLGVFFAIQALAGPGPVAAASAFALPFVVIAGALAARRAIAAIKARVTYPRTGFVTYRKPSPRRRWLTGVLSALFAMMGVVLVQRAAVSPTWIPIFLGLIIGASLLVTAHRFDLGRFYALAGVSMAAGVAAGFMAGDETVGSAAYFSAVGAALLLSGGVVFWSYLRRTRPMQEA